MRAVWKYVLKIEDQQKVTIPWPAKVLAVAMQPTPQGETICLWAEVDPDDKRIEVPIIIVGTGHPLPEPALPGQYLRHISTFQMHGGALIFHAYEGERKLAEPQ